MFRGEPVADRLLRAEQLREGLTLSATDVADLIEDMPDGDYVMEEWINALRQIDATVFKIPVRARRAIEAALGMTDGDLWEVKR
jgi:hypothetical protein